MTQQEDPDLAASEAKEQEAEIVDDVALRPGPNADDPADIERYISAEVRELYDVYALRAFHDCGLISAGVMVTRSASLNPVFEVVPQLNKAGEPVGKTVRAKYGASTTWMGKLLYRLNAGRHGGCPVLVFGITPKLITDWNPPS